MLSLLNVHLNQTSVSLTSLIVIQILNNTIDFSNQFVMKVTYGRYHDKNDIRDVQCIERSNMPYSLLYPAVTNTSYPPNSLLLHLLWHFRPKLILTIDEVLTTCRLTLGLHCPTNCRTFKRQYRYMSSVTLPPILAEGHFEDYSWDVQTLDRGLNGVYTAIDSNPWFYSLAESVLWDAESDKESFTPWSFVISTE